MEIITSFYIPSNKDRQNEIIKCLDNNLSHKCVNKVHLFVDNTQCIDFLKERYKLDFDKKIKICGIGKQPLYSDLFLYCNSLKNKLCMITNSDIWLYNISDIRFFNKFKTNPTSV